MAHSEWRVNAFVLYILTYAYISGGGSIVNHSLQGMGIELLKVWQG
ncbi:tryptophan permease [Shewanella putrefaciens]|nr:tryptophan permease [Shewanella putrefaciens]